LPARPRRALPCQPYLLTGTYACRDPHAENPLAHRDPALCIELRLAQRQLSRCAMKGVFEIDHEAGVLVGPWAARMTALSGISPRVSKQAVEELAELCRFLGGELARRRALPGGVPVWRRLEILAGTPIGAQLIV